MSSELTPQIAGPAAVQRSRPVAVSPSPGAPESADKRQDPVATDKAVQANSPSAVMEPEELDRVVSQLNDHVQNLQRQLQFSVDKESERMVVKVIDAESEEVIRQIPPEEVLTLARRLEDAREGLFVQTNA